MFCVEVEEVLSMKWKIAFLSDGANDFIVKVVKRFGGGAIPGVPLLFCAVGFICVGINIGWE